MTSNERREKVRWLRRYQESLKRIDSMEIELARWQDRTLQMTHQPTYFRHITDDKQLKDMTADELRLNAMPPVIVRGGKPVTIEDAICNIDEIATSINDCIVESQSILDEVNTAINALDNDYVRSVMRYRYINGLKWEEICVKLPCSWNSVHRWHKIGLINVRTLSHTQTW